MPYLFPLIYEVKGVSRTVSLCHEKYDRKKLEGDTVTATRRDSLKNQSRINQETKKRKKLIKNDPRKASLPFAGGDEARVSQPGPSKG